MATNIIHTSSYTPTSLMLLDQWQRESREEPYLLFTHMSGPAIKRKTQQLYGYLYNVRDFSMPLYVSASTSFKSGEENKPK